MKLALGISLLSGAALVILYAILIGVLVSGWKNSAYQLWGVASVQTRDTMMEVVNATLDFVQFAARSVPQMDAALGSKAMGDSGYDPAQLLRNFAAFNELSGYKFGSIGFLMRAKPPRPLNAKVSWQIASGFGCPTYMYAYSDNSINPAFYGYCGQANGTVDFGRRAYTGVDWGLKPEEQQLLSSDGIKLEGVFLPVFDLLGAFTLTYEMAYTGGSTDPYAVTFAELDLTTFSNHISSQIDLFSNRSVAYIYETVSGAMIASNVPNTLFNTENNTRYTIRNVPNAAIKETASLGGGSSSWLVVSTRRTEPGLNWTIVVAVQEPYVYGNMNTSIIIASCASLGVLIFLVTVLWISIHCCVNRQLTAKKAGEPIPYTPFDEVK